MPLPAATREEIERLEAARPDPDLDPEGFREVNDEITRLIDRNRAQQQAEKQRRKGFV